MSFVKSTRLMDSATGEVLREEKHVYNQQVNENGYFYVNKRCTNIIGRADIPESINCVHLGCLFVLARKYLGKNNVLYIKDSRKSRLMNRNDIKKILFPNLTLNAFNRKIKNLFDNKIIIKIKDKKDGVMLMVNPLYALYGKRISLKTYSNFKSALKGNITENGIAELEMALVKEKGGKKEDGVISEELFNKTIEKHLGENA